MPRINVLPKNIADLIATSDGITTPYDRVQDVATRKKPDIRNRGYFLSEFSNKVLNIYFNSISFFNNKLDWELIS